MSRSPRDAVRRERFAELTERELEVLLLITQGVSNAEIGQKLYLREATVKTHVTRVLGKVGVRDRVQAVVLAYETAHRARGRRCAVNASTDHGASAGSIRK